MSCIDALARMFGLESLRAHGAAEVDEVGVRRRLADGGMEEICWDSLEAVMIHTTEDGPWSEDLFWVLFGAEGSGVVVPGGRAHEIDLLATLQQRLPGLDNHAVIAASLCVEENWFPVWRRGQPAEDGGVGAA